MYTLTLAVVACTTFLPNSLDRSRPVSPSLTRRAHRSPLLFFSIFREKIFQLNQKVVEEHNKSPGASLTLFTQHPGKL